MIAALDVGGSSIKRGLVTLPDQVTLVDPLPIDALAPREELLEVFAQVAADLVNGAEECEDLAVAFPRPFDMDKGIPYLQGVDKFDTIYGVELRSVLQSQIDHEIRISFCGDSAAAAVGEALAGAGRSYHRVLMITLGTGFGSAMVVDGEIVEEVNGHVVEDLHLALDRNGVPADRSLSASGLADRMSVSMTNLPAAIGVTSMRFLVERYLVDLVEFLNLNTSKFDPDVSIIGGGAAEALSELGVIGKLPVIPIIVGSLGRGAALLGAGHLHWPSA